MDVDVVVVVVVPSFTSKGGCMKVVGSAECYYYCCYR
jgi:hypothetical protein